MVVTKTPIVVPTDIRWISMLFMIGVFGFAAQIVFATILERIFFKAVPSALSVTGTLIIVSSALYVALEQATKRRDATITKKKSNVRLGGLSEGILEEGLLDELLGAHVAEEQDHGVQTDDRKFLVARKRDHKNEMVLPNSRVPTEEAKLLSENTASAS
ncbi:hypothetical protein H0H87_010522 [Tephrocybe sp. NHM501043]|nr:hypothetical protein H0H87_010522 [Tephrocybe sp. NHM501043]